MDKRLNEFKSTGAVLPMVAIGLLAIMGVAGMAMDLGHGYLNKSRVQNALDAAALSGMRTIMQTANSTLATTHARDAFSAHLEGEMVGLSAADLDVQFSQTLTATTFTPGATNENANYIRVRFNNFQTEFSLSSVLPGIPTSMQIGGSAVAGAIPLGGGELCDIAPVMLCATDNDDDNCGDDTFPPLGNDCFGVEVGGETEYVLKSDEVGGTMGGGVDCDLDPDHPSCAAPANTVDCQADPTHASCPCGGLDNCINPDPENSVGPGNFQLVDLSAALCDNGGAACVKELLAGEYKGCTATNALVDIDSEPGNKVGPVRFGLNTRFGDYGGGFNNSDAVEYPADLVLTERTLAAPNFWHEQYLAATGVAQSDPNTPTGPGAPKAGRRVITAPIVDCDGGLNGSADLTPYVMGFGCFYLTRKVASPGMGAGSNSLIFGQFVGSCEGSGTPGPSPGPITGGFTGSAEIILYKDPDADEA